MMGDFAHFLEILGDAADQVAGLLFIVEAEGQLLEVVEGTALAVHLQVRADLTLGEATRLDEGLERRRFGELTAIAFCELVRDLEWLCG